MAEDVMAAPHRTERAKPGRMEGLEPCQVRADRLTAFHMQDGRENAVVDRLTNRTDRAAEPPGARPVELEGDVRHLHRGRERRQMIEGAARGVA